jgi:hypothetical protein
MKAKRQLPRAALTTDRRTGGAHRVRRELSAREELTLRLNEMHEEGDLDAEEIAAYIETDDDDDYYDYLLDRLETTNG